MKFSLVLCTMNRNDFVENFLKQLNKSSYKNFELIVVDQNKDNFLEKILQKFDFEIKYLKSSPGLSVARNKGLELINGDIISFPDDDCEYPTNILSDVEKIFSRNKHDFISTSSKWHDMKISNGNFDKYSGKITKYTIWRRAISYTLFFKRNAIKNLKFNEQLGVGAKSIFQSGEETDFTLRCIKNGNSGFYYHDLHIYHPHTDDSFDNLKVRLSKYTPGKCYVLLKNNYGIFYIGLYFLSPLLKGLISLLRFNFFNTKLHFLSSYYRLNGIFQFYAQK